MSITQQQKKSLGAFYTPTEIADFLAGWAIRSKQDVVLDPGSGEGVFMKSAHNRLVENGAGKKEARKRIFGIEYDNDTYKILSSEFEGFNVIHSSFFDISPSKKQNSGLPPMDAVIGNPPYIERERLEGAHSIREKMIESNNTDSPLHLVTDAYGYFLIHATSFLKNEGRLAFIVSDSWLNMDFGMALKAFLLKNYRINAIVGFEERVFLNALVRTVLILAEKSQDVGDNQVAFVRLKNIHDIEKLQPILDNKKKSDDSIKIMRIKQSELNFRDTWGVYLKASKSYFDIMAKPIIIPLKEVANIGIGIQSLKNDFYIVDEDRAQQLGLEKKFLEEVVMSPRSSPIVIENKKQIHDFVIYCDKYQTELKGTKLLEYVKKSEKSEVSQRGKEKKVIGYHNVPRINQARRDPWYNMIPEIEKRCRGTIILPRRSYNRFFAVWNKARVVVNDNFINIEPKNPSHVMPLLAILNSSFFEYLCRVRSQTYGGGIHDLRPDDVKNMPLINPNTISKEKLRELGKAYDKFVKSGGTDRIAIDSIMKDILNLKKSNWMELKKNQDELGLLASISSGKGKK
ncbi:N-6 DNA methylase [Candidatus Nitrosotenuis sp. DW1]|uniref:N-6 DNA methylase n=1 Tax=Candidatus Nitrosotenuis sp. DW1 TaxID=2259672 RepID=UPI0015CCB3C0|nr:N-6 DNA methylase [Candidatus Nitrosotenuis sp. DW1]